MVLHSGWWRWDENKAWDRVGRKEKRSTEGLRGSLTCFRFPLPTLVSFGCPLCMSQTRYPESQVSEVMLALRAVPTRPSPIGGHAEGPRDVCGTEDLVHSPKGSALRRM